MQRNLAGNSVLRRFVCDESGVAAVEFAIVSLPLFLLIMAVIEFGLLFLTQMQLENIVGSVARTTSVASGTAADRVTQISEAITQRTSQLIYGSTVIVSVVPVTQTFEQPELCYTNPPRLGGSCPAGTPFEDYNGDGVFNSGSSGGVSSGGSGEVMRIDVVLLWDFFTPFLGQFFGGGSNAKGYVNSDGYVIRTSAVVKNETF